MSSNEEVNDFQHQAEIVASVEQMCAEFDIAIHAIWWAQMLWEMEWNDQDPQE